MSISEKRAALELHNLSSRDREWVLRRLAPVEQARVKPLLAELEAMNIRFDIDGYDKPQAGLPNNGVNIMSPPPSTRSLLRGASAGDVIRVLSDEPRWLVDTVLAIEPWRWGAAVRHALAQRSGA